MLSTKTDYSSYKAYLNGPFDRFLAGLLGHRTRWRSLGHSCPHQPAVSVQIVSQIPQPHLGFYPHQTYGAHDQLPRPLRLHPKNMFHSTPDSGTRSITLDLSIRQLLIPAPLPPKDPQKPDCHEPTPASPHNCESVYVSHPHQYDSYNRSGSVHPS
jgi:hypothetical protein